MKKFLIIDNDHEEVRGFLDGLASSTDSNWNTILFENNKEYNMKRYIKFFISGLKLFKLRFKNQDSLFVTWQQFYGIIFAFLCDVFKVKKNFQLIIMTFIYKEKNGVGGNLFYWLIKKAVRSKYVDKIICTSSYEVNKYSKIFGVPKEKFQFIPWGIPEGSNYNQDIGKEKYIFSTGRSNRDYDFLINTVADTPYKLIIACDNLKQPPYKNIRIYDNLFGNDMLDCMKCAWCVVISLEDTTIAAGQLVLLQAMSLGKPVIVTSSKGVTDDYVTDGVTGIVIEKTSSALLKALNDLNSNQEMYTLIQKNCVKEFKRRFTDFSLGKNLGEIVNWVSINE